MADQNKVGQTNVSVQTPVTHEQAVDFAAKKASAALEPQPEPRREEPKVVKEPEAEKPNLTRQSLEAMIEGKHLDAGKSPEEAKSLAKKRADQMVVEKP